MIMVLNYIITKALLNCCIVIYCRMTSSMLYSMIVSTMPSMSFSGNASICAT